MQALMIDRYMAMFEDKNKHNIMKKKQIKACFTMMRLGAKK